MAESFSSPGDVARSASNPADSMHTPHPQPAPSPYDKDQYQVEAAWTADPNLAPGCVRGFDYSSAHDDDSR